MFLFNSNFKRSQSSLEFLIIMGIGFLIIVVFGSIFFSYVGEAKSSLDVQQIEKIGKEVITTVEKIYFLGSGNKVLLKMTFPEGIENISIYHINNSNSTDEIYFDYLNISYYGDGGVISNIFTTSEIYIRFNCTRCYNGPRVNGSWISYYNDTSDVTGGFKMVQIQNEGDWVSIDFYKGD